MKIEYKSLIAGFVLGACIALAVGWTIQKPYQRYWLLQKEKSFTYLLDKKTGDVYWIRGGLRALCEPSHTKGRVLSEKEFKRGY